MTTGIGRRQFISALGGAAAWPLAAYAQQSERMRRVGVLVGNVTAATDPLALEEIPPFQEAMRDAGWIDGKTMRVDYRFGAANSDQIQSAAAELVALDPDLIYAITLKAVQALQQRTNKIPIVFSQVVDPVGMGIVASLGHPGGNVTGFSAWDPPMSGKWLQLLREIAPDVNRIGIIYDPEVAPYAESVVAAGERFASQDLSLVRKPVSTVRDIQDVAMSFSREPHSGLWVIGDPFTTEHEDEIIAEAARYHLPSIYGNVVSVERGGLVAYAQNTDAYMRQPVSYIDRILKGVKPSDLPVQNPTKFMLVIN